MEKADIGRRLADDKKAWNEVIHESRSNEEDRLGVSSYDESMVLESLRKRTQPDVKDLKLRYKRRKLKSEE